MAKKLSTIISAEFEFLMKQMSGEMKTAVEENNREMKAFIQTQKQEIKKRDEEIRELKDRILQLENTDDELEQYSRRNSLRIFGLPENEVGGEDPTVVALKLFNETMELEKAGCPVSPAEIDRAHRVGPKTPGSERPMLVKFTQYRPRARVFKAKSKLRTSTAGPTTGTTRRIFVNEDLTKVRVKLLYQARKAKKEKKIKDCWTHDGQVLIKNNANKVTPIRNNVDLLKITG